MPAGRLDVETGSAVKAAADSPRPLNADLGTLQNQVRELQRNAQYRSLFLSRLAHELRTPLTSILGFSEILLSQERLTDAQRGFCHRIQRSAQQLQSSLNQLSDLARLEAGQTKLSFEQIALGETLRDVLAELARSAEKKRVRITLALDDNVPAVNSDRARVRVVVYNLLANAIFRSPEDASISVEARATTNAVALSISDRGDPIIDPSQIGILEADDTSSTSELGLSIARQNIEVLGGTLSARNGAQDVEVVVHLPVLLTE